MFKNLLRFEKVTVMHHLSRNFQNMFGFFGGKNSPSTNSNLYTYRMKKIQEKTSTTPRVVLQRFALLSYKLW